MLYPLSYEGGAGADRGAEVPGALILGGLAPDIGWRQEWCGAWGGAMDVCAGGFLPLGRAQDLRWRVRGCVGCRQKALSSGPARRGGI